MALDLALGAVCFLAAVTFLVTTFLVALGSFLGAFSSLIEGSTSTQSPSSSSSTSYISLGVSKGLGPKSTLVILISFVGVSASITKVYSTPSGITSSPSKALFE